MLLAGDVELLACQVARIPYYNSRCGIRGSIRKSLCVGDGGGEGINKGTSGFFGKKILAEVLIR